MKAIKLRCEYLNNPIGIDIKSPRLYWNCEGGVKQTAYRIWANVDGKTYDTGKVTSSRMTHIPFEKELPSRSIAEWKVKLWDETDQEGEWSDTAHFEMGLLKEADWSAKWISANQTIEKKKRYPADYFRKRFQTGNVKKARIYAAACGIYELFINGNRVGNDVLKPGSTNYRKLVQYQTYDVTGLLREGENEITAVLADGWYRSYAGANNASNLYGDETKLLVQMEITDSEGQKMTIATDDTWDWSSDGPVRYADMKGGESIEAEREPSYGEKAKVVSHTALLAASNNVAIREHEQFKPAVITSPAGQKILDFGQNIAGFLDFHIMAKAGDKIHLRLGEYLKDGEFTTINVDASVGKKPEQIVRFQTIEYTCKEGMNHYRSAFAIYGYRYVLVETDIDWKAEDFTAIAVYSDMEQTVRFSSSEKLLNQFVDCTIWSAKNNHADVPTDCPTRERVGWTGDAQIFCSTASYIFQYMPFGRKYIKDMKNEQLDTGSYTQTAPRGEQEFFMKMLDSSAGWSDAGILIPYRLWKQYGDRRVLEENYESMARYGEFVIGRLGKKSVFSKKIPVSKEAGKYLAMKGLSYGEWIEPKELVPFQMKDLSKPHIEESTAYSAYVLRLLAEIAEELGKREDAGRYREYADHCKAAYQELIHVKEYSLDTNRQAKLVRPLYMELLDNKDKAYAQKRLLEALDFFRWRVGTGFLSTPFILYVLNDIDVSYAYKLLENEEIPGWLAMPKNGATTIWEDWEGIFAEPEAASLNHYSKGAACEWIFRNMCGVEVDGENHFHIAPQPGGTISSAKLAYTSIYGEVRSEWEMENDTVIYRITIPANTTATIQLADQTYEASSGNYEYKVKM